MHTTEGGERRLTLQAVLDDDQIVMTAIGSDADDPTGTAETQWTTMRQALLIQLRAALKALGWQETGTGPAWYSVEFSGGPTAVIPVVESPTATVPMWSETTQAPAPSTSTEAPTEPTQEPTAEPTSEPAQPGTDVADLVSLIGRTIDDPAVEALARTCGPGSDWHRSGNIACESAGFELTLGGAGLQVKAITLFNFEYSGYNQYQGTLPLGLTWDDDYATILDKLGAPLQRLGGNGLEVQLRYRSGAAYVLVTTTATHDNPDYLTGAKIHWIELSVDPVQGYPPS